MWRDEKGDVSCGGLVHDFSRECMSCREEGLGERMWRMWKQPHESSAVSDDRCAQDIKEKEESIGHLKMQILDTRNHLNYLEVQGLFDNALSSN